MCSWLLKINNKKIIFSKNKKIFKKFDIDNFLKVVIKITKINFLTKICLNFYELTTNALTCHFCKMTCCLYRVSPRVSFLPNLYIILIAFSHFWRLSNLLRVCGNYVLQHVLGLHDPVCTEKICCVLRGNYVTLFTEKW